MAYHKMRNTRRSNTVIMKLDIYPFSVPQMHLYPSGHLSLSIQCNVERCTCITELLGDLAKSIVSLLSCVGVELLLDSGYVLSVIREITLLQVLV